LNKLKAAHKDELDLNADSVIQELERLSQEAENAGLDVTEFGMALSHLNSGMTIQEALDSIETDMYQIGDAAFDTAD
jgi:hypothetical protein